MVANANPLFSVETGSENNFDRWMKDFSTSINGRQHDGELQFPDNFANGFAKAGKIGQGLSYRLTNYTLNADYEHLIVPTQDFKLLIYIYDLTAAETATATCGSKAIQPTGHLYSIAVVTTSHIQKKLMLKKGTTVKGLTIQIDEQWLWKQFRRLDIARFEQIKNLEFENCPLTAKEKKILGDIFEKINTSVLPELHINSRILRLTEKILTYFADKAFAAPTFLPTDADRLQLQKIEAALCTGYKEEFPGIEHFARQACMSQSKLKKIFKEVYGLGIFEYWQKNRIHKAKEMILSGQHSISQTGLILGYQNLSNFSNAFRKEIGCLPSELRKEI
jgi:AraC-like DNA-binding protein